MGLDKLEKEIARDLSMINYPPKPWRFEDEEIFDVVIIGAGIAGLSAAFALLKLGISKIALYDQSEEGKEGPWVTYARMKTLRSPKTWMGPALGVPSLTFQSWFEAQFGTVAWDGLGKISRPQWMDYLKWFRKVLKLPVENQVKLLSIAPHQNHLNLHLSKGNVKTHKVVLATGRAGFGGPEFPKFIHTIPKSQWAHTNEQIDFDSLKGKRIAIIGGGDAGFDAAATALDHRAASVDLFIRRPLLPNVNPGRELFYHGCYLGYYSLKDEEKWKFYLHMSDKGHTPPRETLERISHYSHFRFHANADIQQIVGHFDYYILASGLNIDGNQQPELKPFMNEILLWKDRGFTDHTKLGRFPYLGPHFEFLEKRKGEAPYLKDIYCFNYGSTLSLSTIGSEIPPISSGAERLAEGIAIDFFLQDKQKHFEKFKNYNDPEYRHEEFPFFSI